MSLRAAPQEYLLTRILPPFPSSGIGFFFACKNGILSVPGIRGGIRLTTPTHTKYEWLVAVASLDKGTSHIDALSGHQYQSSTSTTIDREYVGIRGSHR